MRNLVNLIWKNYFFFLFLLLEILCISFVVENNYYQKASIINSSNAVSANILETSSNIKEYFNLRAENERLSQENAALLSHSLKSFYVPIKDFYKVIDTTHHQKYTYTSAKVVNNSTSGRNNYLTLDKGYKQGIQQNMAVITSNGIVGQIKNVSENFCTVMSLLHSKTTVNAKIKKDGSYGPLTWNDDDDYAHATLSDIPTHVRWLVGDTIVTSAYSLTFPEDVIVGTIESCVREKSFLIMKIKLSTDFKKLTHVYIVNNMYKQEQEDLEKKSKTEKEN